MTTCRSRLSQISCKRGNQGHWILTIGRSCCSRHGADYSVINPNKKDAVRLQAPGCELLVCRSFCKQAGERLKWEAQWFMWTWSWEGSVDHSQKAFFKPTAQRITTYPKFIITPTWTCVTPLSQPSTGQVGSSVHSENVLFLLICFKSLFFPLTQLSRYGRLIYGTKTKTSSGGNAKGAGTAALTL